ncbi:hypothetical protein AMS68_004871 [Peltaster fructicola]|uniref:RNA helicase n=1 Tax=Peltaster fructicola TaxID=286661 RepID=A0A6H0XX96_9PEZI|nr:hypothetical protein AMS68_004871 [Peltaster fructicola]
MRRASSPALSETEVDISKHLFNQDGDDSEEDFLAEATSHPRPVKPVETTASDILSIGQDDEDDDDAFIAATQAATPIARESDNKASKKAGAFQTMGLNTNLLKAITRKGFSVPTPIQRKTIPLVLDGQDVVGMARTGSGKTAAFVIPMIERLKAHSAKVGARAIVLSPSRELALQTLKVIKEMSRGTDLRTILLVGGDSLEEQFSSMASNPDIIVATPGRFEHLKVEMALELSSVKYIVFDEADRLFEMGFAAQLAEIMHSLPTERQTLLFSATLPKSLVEFARAGLHDPKLVRLDAETKIAPGLKSAFFSVKRAEKEGALLNILENVIKMPIGSSITKQPEATHNKKRKRGHETPANEQPSPHSTVIFAATKHHVDYLAVLLKSFGYAVSYVYGSLDQTARKMQVQDFRSGLTNILVVTDVAARGLDIPVLANVVNYDFPSQPKIYVHRVGRTARAGKEGWSYSLITQQDMPYLLDLQLFLSRKLIVGRGAKEADMFKHAIVLGALKQQDLESNIEEATRMIEKDTDLTGMRVVAEKGEKQYTRTRNAASAESVKRAKQLALSQELKGVNMLFDDDGIDLEAARLEMLARVSGFRPQETVFEVGKRGKQDEAAEFMRNRRAKIKPRFQSHGEDAPVDDEEGNDNGVGAEALDSDSDDELILTRPHTDMEEASDDELELTFTRPNEQKKGKQGWQDNEHFMSYTPAGLNVAEDRGYGVHSGSNSNFVTEAKGISMDLNNDESKAFGEASKAKGMRWDKKHKKYVSRVNDEDGSKGKKYIIGESGQKIAASFRSGRFDAWRKANKVGRLPRVGEIERGNAHYTADSAPGKRFKHKQEKAPKDADKYRDDYYKRKKKVEEAKEARRGRFAEGKGKSELKGADDVRKMRKLQERRKDKNARPSRKR